MISTETYVQWSLQYHLFWLRILKEHAIFIEATMPPPGKSLALAADAYKQNYDQFLKTAVSLSNGVIPFDVINSGQYYTQYTEEAERLAERYTGIRINTDITLSEYDIEPLSVPFRVTGTMEQEISLLNQNILSMTDSFVQFQSQLLNNRSSCGIFTMMYTGDLLHILLEAKRYQMILSALEQRDENAIENYKTFWTQNMADHAKVMRGQFDPTENAYFNRANMFANLFDTLSQEEMNPATFPSDTTLLKDTSDIRDFKADTTEALISCKVQAIMLSLYTDHLLREANHFLFLLQ
ncbi:DUF2935 domain-containing protein [Lacrimispora sp. JR3]|uniref:DUF2935 domain-containing protein n=1 Tax=Lacrimispora sinapis TaxID=3111456 RepID=UPI003749B99C